MVGWIKIEEGALPIVSGPIIAGDEVLIVQALNRHARQTGVQVFKHRDQIRQIELRPFSGGDAEAVVPWHPAEGGGLQIQKPRSTFQVCQDIGIEGFQPIKVSAGAKLVLQHGHKLRVVAVHNPKQGADFAVCVVDNLCLGLHGAAQKDTAHADKGCGVGGVVNRVVQRFMISLDRFWSAGLSSAPS